MADILTKQPRTSSVLGYLSLFTSFGTLLCCALPSLLVLVGLGATVASLLSAVPWLVALSRHKVWVFAASGVLIGANLLHVYAIAPSLKSAGESCPADAPEACASASRFSKMVLWLSAVIYAVGVFSAFVLGPLLMRFG
jgi:hypothetical protein